MLHVQTQTLCQHITLHSFLVPHPWLKAQEVSAQNIFSFHLLFFAMSHDLHSTPSILSSLSLASTSPSFTASGPRSMTSRIHCADSRDLGGDGLTDPELRRGYEPKWTVDNPIVVEQEIEHSTEESQIPEIEDKFSLPYKQSSLSSPQDSVECLATPQEADLDDEHIRALLASPRYLPEREVSAERSQVYHSERESLMSRSSQRLNFIGTGKPAAWLSHQKSLGQDEFQKESNVLKLKE